MTTVTVLSGAERRRRWSISEKLRIVEESLSSEASVAEVARQHDVHPNLLHHWRRQARTGVLGRRAATGSTAGEVHFAAVAMTPDERVLSAPAAGSAPGVIEIEFASGARLRITGAVAPAAVSAAVSAVAGARR